MNIVFTAGRSRSISREKTRTTKRNRIFFRSLPHVLRGVLSFIKYLIVHRKAFNSAAPVWNDADNAVLICSYFTHLDKKKCESGEFYSYLWEQFPDYLQSSGYSLNWVHHYLPSSATHDLDTARKWIADFHEHCTDRHALLESYLSWGQVRKALVQWFSLVRLSRRIGNLEDYLGDGLLKCVWPLLRSDWKKSIEGQVAASNAFWIVQFDELLSGMPTQPVGLYLQENQGWEVAFLHFWRKHSHGNVIGVPHTTVAFWHLFYFPDSRWLNYTRNKYPMPDIMAVNGDPAYDAFIISGIEPKMLRKVEAIRYLGHDTSFSGSKTSYSQKNNTKKNRLLLLGDISQSSMLYFDQTLKSSIAELETSFDICFKPHPAFDYNFNWSARITSIPTTTPLTVALRDVDVVVAANTTSSAAEAYINNIPVIILLIPDEINLSPLRTVEDVRFVTDSTALVDALLNSDTLGRTSAAAGNFFYLDRDLPGWKKLLPSIR